MNSTLRSLLRIFLRDVLAVAMVSGVFGLMVCDAHFCGDVGDNGFVENAQVAICTAAAVLFLVAARRNTPWRRALILVALTLFAMAVRELDALADEIFHGAWKLFEIPLLALFVWQLFRYWREACDSLLALLTTTTGRHLELAALCLLVFSRLMGTKGIWQMLITDRALFHVAKNAIEEGTELFGYMLFLLCALDALRATARMARTAPEKAA